MGQMQFKQKVKMMSVKNVNEVLLVGYVGRDCEVRSLSTGTKVGNFSMATSRSWKVGEEWKSESTWHNVVIWGKDSDKSNLITKGSAVMVRGRISVEKWTDKTGIEKQTNKINAYSVEILVNEKSGQSAYQGQGPQQTARESLANREVAEIDSFDDDLPF